MARRPSQHVSWGELNCRDGSAYPENSPYLEDLMELFEDLRAYMGGKPLKINCGYRSPTHNAKVGGAKRSWHVRGAALDVKIPAHQHQRVLAWARGHALLGGLGLYKTFVHVDVRPQRNGKYVFWDYR